MPLSPRATLALVLATAVLGVGVGVGATLLFVERGPQGATGETGPQGPVSDASELYGRVNDVEATVSDFETSIGSLLHRATRRGLLRAG